MSDAAQEDLTGMPTPGPWVVSTFHSVLPGRTHFMIETIDGRPITKCESGSVNDAVDQANAALIVKAVNGHQGLIDVLNFYAGETVHGLAGDNGYRARAALALLKLSEEARSALAEVTR